MKTLRNLFLLTLFACAMSFTYAQDAQDDAGPTGKNGETVLPEADDWAISFDATPFLNYAGRLFSGAGSTSPNLGYTNGYPWSIKGKMFMDATTALRVGLRIGIGNTTNRNELDIADTVIYTYPTFRPKVEDEYQSSYSSIVITGGLEFRRGHGRLQGFYGGEVIFGIGGSKDTWTYGNALSTTNPAATGAVTAAANTTDWGALGFTTNMATDPTGTGARLTESKTSTMTVGLRGFIGVEYFIIPKISIGGEYGWGFGISSSTMTQTMESNLIVTAPAYAMSTFDTETKTNGLAIDSDIQNAATGLLGPTGALNITFHF